MPRGRERAPPRGGAPAGPSIGPAPTPGQVPAPPPPDIVHCAALIGLAQTEMLRREGMSPTTSKLAVYAALLTGQARDKLRADGKTQNESDVILGTTRDALLDDTAKKQAAGLSAAQDFEACFALANPPKEPHKAMQHR